MSHVIYALAALALALPPRTPSVPDGGSSQLTLPYDVIRDLDIRVGQGLDPSVPSSTRRSVFIGSPEVLGKPKTKEPTETKFVYVNKRRISERFKRDQLMMTAQGSYKWLRIAAEYARTRTTKETSNEVEVAAQLVVVFRGPRLEGERPMTAPTNRPFSEAREALEGHYQEDALDLLERFLTADNDQKRDQAHRDFVKGFGYGYITAVDFGGVLEISLVGSSKEAISTDAIEASAEARLKTIVKGSANIESTEYERARKETADLRIEVSATPGPNAYLPLLENQANQEQAIRDWLSNSEEGKGVRGYEERLSNAAPVLRARWIPYEDIPLFAPIVNWGQRALGRDTFLRVNYLEGWNPNEGARYESALLAQAPADRPKLGVRKEDQFFDFYLVPVLHPTAELIASQTELRMQAVALGPYGDPETQAASWRAFVDASKDQETRSQLALMPAPEVLNTASISIELGAVMAGKDLWEDFRDFRVTQRDSISVASIGTGHAVKDLSFTVEQVVPGPTPESFTEQLFRIAEEQRLAYRLVVEDRDLGIRAESRLFRLTTLERNGALALQIANTPGIPEAMLAEYLTVTSGLGRLERLLRRQARDRWYEQLTSLLEANLGPMGGYVCLISGNTEFRISQIECIHKLLELRDRLERVEGSTQLDQHAKYVVYKNGSHKVELRELIDAFFPDRVGPKSVSGLNKFSTRYVDVFDLLDKYVTQVGEAPSE